MYIAWLLSSLLLTSEALPASPEPLSFKEFFEPSARALQPTARLLGLRGKRVRLVGYMAQMDMPPKGGFYLCGSPVLATEAGGGTADLPPDAVLVVVRSAQGKALAHIPRPLEVTGVLELGFQAAEDGRASMIRVVLDPPAAGAPPSPPPSHPR